MLLRFILFILFSFNTNAELYRCETPIGDIQFTDQPCQASGSTYKPKAVMTNYKSIEPVKLKPKKKLITHKNQCPFFTSTELRNLKVKDQFKKGLTQEYIQRRLGKADDISSNKSKSTLVYSGNYVKRVFNFKNGCLTSWKEKWKKGKESKISKFRDER